MKRFKKTFVFKISYEKPDGTRTSIFIDEFEAYTVEEAKDNLTGVYVYHPWYRLIKVKDSPK